MDDFWAGGITDLAVVQLLIGTWKIIGADGINCLVVVQFWIATFIFLAVILFFIFTYRFPFHRASPRLHPSIFCCIVFFFDAFSKISPKPYFRSKYKNDFDLDFMYT